MSAADATASHVELQLFTALEAAAVSCEVIGFAAFVDCIHILLRRGECSAKVGQPLESNPPGFTQMKTYD